MFIEMLKKIMISVEKFMRILVIVPAYNESESIEKVIEELKKYKELDYVIVNDGSIDNTAEICKRNNYNIIDLPINLGLTDAFQAGMKYAEVKDYDCAIQLDGDGQHNPEFISLMAEEIEKGYDIVIASRFVNEKKPKSLRMLGSNLLQIAIYIASKTKIKDPTSGMRMYGKDIIKEYAQNLNYGPEPDTVSFLLKNGAKVKEIQSVMNERFSGESYLNAATSVNYMMRMMISILFVQNYKRK